MKYCANRISDLTIAYIGGGSRGWAWTFMNDLALDEQLSGTVRLYDIDIEAARANKVIGNALSAREDVCGKWKYEVKSTLELALKGADFVVISILPKGFDEMETDVHMPERLGIYQSVGDTAGPGGAIRAMRTLPMFVEFAQAIREYCPEAWVINYTNPMSLCVKTMYHVFPGIKAFGCCHEVFGTQKLLGAIIRESGEIDPNEQPERHEIHTNVMGINHFTWFDSASYKGIDLFPIYRRFIDEHYEDGWSNPSVEENLNKNFVCRHRVKFDLFRRYGLIAAAGDRHLAEFMPGDMYLKNPETVESWGFALTPVSWRKKDLEERLARSRRLESGDEQLSLRSSGEEGILLIKALCGLCELVSNVNIPNTFRQIANLPSTAVVESNAVFSRNSIRPVCAGSLPSAVLELIMPHVKNHDRIMKAAVIANGSYAGLTGEAQEYIYDVFLSDPLLKGRASADDLRHLADDMLAATL